MIAINDLVISLLTHVVFFFILILFILKSNIINNLCNSIEYFYKLYQIFDQEDDEVKFKELKKKLLLIGYELTFVTFKIILIVFLGYCIKLFSKSFFNLNINYFDFSLNNILSFIISLQILSYLATKKSDYSNQHYFFDIVQRNTFISDFLLTLENFFFDKKIKDQEVKKIVFIMGMSRSGTTSLLNYIYFNTKSFATTLYKDLPFILSPNVWQKFLKKRIGKKINRFHKDGLRIDNYSPEGFEEFFWEKKIPNYEENFNKILKKKKVYINFENDYKYFVKKICLVRNKVNYLMKNNYNLFRIPLILSVFPNAKIFITIRNPSDHCNSLNRVHKEFLKENKINYRFSNILSFLKHYEFGPKKKFYNFTFKKTKKNANQLTYSDYLDEWIFIHKFILKILPIYKNNICVVDSDMLNNSEVLEKINKIVKLKFSEVLPLTKKINFYKNSNHPKLQIAKKIFNQLKSHHI